MTVDWNSVFVPSLGIAEIVVRGTLMYLALFAILRFIGRRHNLGHGLDHEDFQGRQQVHKERLQEGRADGRQAD